MSSKHERHTRDDKQERANLKKQKMQGVLQ